VVQLYEHSRTTLAAPLRVFYPECLVYIKDTQLYPLRCLRDGCHKMLDCGGVVGRRISALFEAFRDARRFLMYFRHEPSGLGVAMFRSETSDPSLLGRVRADGRVVVNESAWRVFARRCVVVSWEPPVSLFAERSLIIEAPQLVTLGGART
jgi:hypothetical protein